MRDVASMVLSDRDFDIMPVFTAQQLVVIYSWSFQVAMNVVMRIRAAYPAYDDGGAQWAKESQLQTRLSTYC